MNLSIMVLGLWLLKRFGRKYGAKVPSVNLGVLLDDQLKEITGSSSGFVKSAVDQLIEELSVMAQNNEIERDVDYLCNKVDLKDIGSLKILAIHFNKIFPAFKAYAKRTNYEGDLLDKESYRKLFAECEYVIDGHRPVRLGTKAKRCLVIDYQKAKAAGLDLDGFR